MPLQAGVILALVILTQVMMLFRIVLKRRLPWYPSAKTWVVVLELHAPITPRQRPTTKKGVNVSADGRITCISLAGDTGNEFQ